MARHTRGRAGRAPGPAAHDAGRSLHGVRASRRGRHQPAARLGSGARGAASGRQRHRRRGHRRGGAERDRAADDRHRRRHVRHRVAGPGAEAGRAQRERPRGLAHDPPGAPGPRLPARIAAGRDVGDRARRARRLGTLVRTYGRRTLAPALEPAIGYARDGFPLTPIIAAQWAGETAFLQRDSAAAATFLPGGRAPRAGEWFQNPDYARTLQSIADQGIGIFYGGPLGQRIVARLAALDGFITLDDLKRNAPTWVTPISVPFRGYRVWELPPSNQGVAALEMLRILEPYDLKAMGHNSAAYLHHLIEAKKLSYADLDRFVGDAA